MKNKYLSAILLVLIGIVLGTLFAYYQNQFRLDDKADVKVTEIRHSQNPLFTDADLSKIGPRFLFKKVAKKVTPAVVYIETVVPFEHPDIPDDKFHDKKKGFWNRIFPKRTHTVGSGILISSDGYILTNNHVIEDALEGKIHVILNDKRSYQARIVGNDPTTDLAVIKIDDKNLPFITIGNSDKLDIGEWVLAVGNPFRLRSTVTAGIVSALDRDMRIIDDKMRIENFIQTDAAINRGNSGGALVNTSGELVGVNTAIASQTGNYEGYGFAVPSNLAQKVFSDIIKYGEVHRALLGITIATVNAPIAEELNMPEIKGVVITGLASQGAAKKYGLARKDVILRINGDPVNKSNRLQQKIAIQSPGSMVDFTIWREGRELHKKVRLKMLDKKDNDLIADGRSDAGNPAEEFKKREESPAFQRVAFASFDFGLRVISISKADDPDWVDFKVSEVEKNSLAEAQGFKKGMRILKVNHQKVSNMDSLKSIVKKGIITNSSVLFKVMSADHNINTITIPKQHN